jgi:DNA (cytosine-5)-methyltransferase 1
MTKSFYDEIHSILNKNLKVGNSIINPDEIQKKHEIVIGNPPYGNILTREEKEHLKKENIFSKDIYCAFLLKAINLSSGITAFLIPKSFLLRQGYIRFRNLFLSKANIVKIIDIGPNIFKDATNEVQILIYEKKEEHNNSLKVYDYPHKKIIEKFIK